MRTIVLSGFVLSMLTNLFLAGVLLMRKETVREIIIPPAVKQSFWVDGENLDRPYLEEMGVFLLKLFTDATPDDVDYNTSLFLRYVGPQSYGDLQKVMLAMGTDLKSNAATKAFAIRSIAPRPAEKSVLFSGQATTYVGGQKTSEEPRNYFMAFTFSNGRLYLSELRQVDENFARTYLSGAALGADAAASAASADQ